MSGTLAVMGFPKLDYVTFWIVNKMDKISLSANRMEESFFTIIFILRRYLIFNPTMQSEILFYI